MTRVKGNGGGARQASPMAIAARFAHALLEIFKAPGLHHFLQPLFTAFAAHGIQKKNSERGANGRSDNKEGQAARDFGRPG